MTGKFRMAYLIFAVVVLAGAGLAAAALWDSASVGVVASYSTDLAPRSAQQRHNILRAGFMINNVLIQPGEEFSFNKAVGLCGAEQGFERAPTIVDGQLRPEWGGGVCQVSSTLYNAALLANLKISERHAHSRRVSSVPPGRDATTAFGIADLRFVNTTGAPIRIRVSNTTTRLLISILGKPNRKLDVDVFTQTPNSSNGNTVLTYRTTCIANNDSRRELISSDVYPTPAHDADRNEVAR